VIRDGLSTFSASIALEEEEASKEVHKGDTNKSVN
jgi:hypothetical protein